MVLDSICHQLCKFVFIITKLPLVPAFTSVSSKNGLIDNNGDEKFDKKVCCVKDSLYDEAWNCHVYVLLHLKFSWLVLFTELYQGQ